MSKKKMKCRICGDDFAALNARLAKLPDEGVAR